jgi:large subunit ribosomal protein L11
MGDISVLIEAGKATAAAPLGPALGPLGVNIGEIVTEINEKTKGYAGMKVPVKISIDTKKNVEITVGSPPTSALIKKEAGVQKGSDNPKVTSVANLTIDQIKKVAEMKIENLSSHTIKSAMKEIIGTCNSLGITVDGKPAKKVQREIRHGEYAAYFESIGEKGTEEISEKDAKKDAMEERDEAADIAKQKYLEKHPEMKKEAEAEEKAESEVEGAKNAEGEAKEGEAGERKPVEAPEAKEGAGEKPKEEQK